ncbi:putative protein FRD2 [Escherichia phage 348Ecol098PP]|jgi:hypothetical protein|uniref:FRD2 protein n=2 Tax=Mosigvirus TaxID=1913652 RepID=A0A060BI47_9CAUD|nr:hypothetical protein JS09_0210 [Escherichia phage vB_EcoM_JS09]YP_010247075.1 hypothetical protein D299_gp228 [Escherichia phage HX01]UAW07044.1 hypothetical protein [Escherichia phage vB_EcoM-pEK20]WLY86222.1 putative protein FRD2 [Escherichia phage 308Ecol101PP]WLY86693.1 putative protein FRD2 [Escherichia phage 348Ecol098PP]CAH1486979.1 hypothetical protein UGJNECP1_00152 [Escherichia phage UGJNEcP1]CAH1616310.1 hypothetical protein UGJNECP2_00060 [Escherichia phage UGJNEcP2]
MEIGKSYIINPLFKDDFVQEAPHNNAKMLKLIELHGPSFVVNGMEPDYDSDTSNVVSVTMEDGTVCSAGGEIETYFEIYPDEFKYFIEYFTEVTLEKPQPTNEGITLGVTKIHCIVDETNVDEIIKLLQKTFKK